MKRLLPILAVTAFSAQASEHEMQISAGLGSSDELDKSVAVNFDVQVIDNFYIDTSLSFSSQNWHEKWQYLGEKHKQTETLENANLSVLPTYRFSVFDSVRLFASAGLILSESTWLLEEEVVNRNYGRWEVDKDETIQLGLKYGAGVEIDVFKGDEASGLIKVGYYVSDQGSVEKMDGSIVDLSDVGEISVSFGVRV